MSDLFSNGGVIEQVDLCGLPIEHDVLSYLLESSAIPGDFPRNEVALLASDPVFCACAASAAAAVPFRGAGPAASTLESVIRRLGPRGLTALAAHAAVRRQYSAAPSQVHGALRELRSQGITRSRIALVLAERTGYERPEEAQFAALLLDLGRIALLGLKNAPQVPSLGDGEQAELGARLLTDWGYGALLCDALRYQSEQAHQLADAHPLVKIAHAARRLSEAGPSRIQVVCSLVAALLGCAPGAISGLTDLESTTMRASDQRLQPGAPAPGAESVFGAVSGDAPLAGLVSQRVLLGEMRAYWSAADAEKDMLHAIAQVLTLFFGVRQALYLRRDGDLLRGVDLFGSGSPFSEISVRLHAHGSLIARAATGTDFLHNLGPDTPTLTVVDRQVLGVLASGGMLCLPLAADGEGQGIFLAGLHPCRRDWLENHKGLLQGFAAQAGQALAIVRRRQAHANWNRQASLSDCNLRARRAAHEVRTPLAVIGNYVSVIQMKLAQGQRVDADLEVIAGELARSDRIIREFCDGFREETKVRELALNAMVRELAGLLGDTLIKDRGVKLTLSLDDRVPAALDLDAQAVRSVLINLAWNAIDAMHEGDSLQLATEDRLRFEDGDYVAVSVADTGPGLPAEVLARLFEPTRSTKGGEHQGLGLSIVKDLADRMGARIICRSREGAGTTFTVLLPRKCAASTASFTSAGSGSRP
jgi:signal transduction histidine kinase/HD-like signal output (HDOD) protein